MIIVDKNEFISYIKIFSFSKNIRTWTNLNRTLSKVVRKYEKKKKNLCDLLQKKIYRLDKAQLDFSSSFVVMILLNFLSRAILIKVIPLNAETSARNSFCLFCLFHQRDCSVKTIYNKVKINLISNQQENSVHFFKSTEHVAVNEPYFFPILYLCCFILYC